jgi:hypothetical protein
MDSLFWQPSDLHLDTDIRREGLEIQTRIPTTGHTYKLQAGAYRVEEHADSDQDPILLGLQALMAQHNTARLHTKIGLSYYSLHEARGANLDHSAGTNSRRNGGLAHHYNVLTLSTQATQKQVPGLKTITWTAEYGQNLAIDTDNTSYLLGVAVGTPKPKACGDWTIGLSYRRLETDSVLDIFPDSDAYKGQTDVEGLEFKVGYALNPDLILALDIYSMDTINRASNRLLVVQSDVTLRF